LPRAARPFTIAAEEFLLSLWGVPLSSEGSITGWLHLLRGGQAMAAQRLWERYFQRLVALARSRLQGTPRRAADEEDVALAAFESFCLGAQEGRFPRLADRDDLWQVLVMLTARQANRLRKLERRQKRGGGKVQAETDLSAEDPVRLAEVIGPEPTPEFAAQVADEYRRLLDKLGDAELRSVALWKMEGFTLEEIAARLGRSLRTVERKVQLIRILWEEEVRP
jgi:DNA-directed RNA polymerase specialized sigma24 family protein